ncbi:hypothetical protein BDB01DRAFT_771987 [Pilobolus umbonatus]|nr:hypothetical protein BDB01DRAFT_771987 [Pilobolus umbonatus]
MTVDNGFPVGYFYIVSKLNGLALDIDTTEPIAAGSMLITAPIKEEKPARDTQLWIHQNGKCYGLSIYLHILICHVGFLTNKHCGLVMDIGRSKKFFALFTGEQHLYVDVMKHEERALDQRFGYSPELGYIYTLCEPNDVLDIRKRIAEAGATIMIHEKNEDTATSQNQFWTFRAADPHKKLDSSDDDEDDDKRARLRAWFGNWWGWGKDDENDLLNEKELNQAHKKVYETNKSHLSYEVIAGAVAVQAVQMYIQRQEEMGEDVHFKGAKQAIAAYAAKEMVKMFLERGTDDDDDDDDDDVKEKKQNLLQNMATSAATNYFESKYK